MLLLFERLWYDFRYVLCFNGDSGDSQSGDSLKSLVLPFLYFFIFGMQVQTHTLACKYIHILEFAELTIFVREKSGFLSKYSTIFLSNNIW